MMPFHGESLPFCFETRDHLAGIHAEFDNLQGNAAPDWFALLGHLDGAEASFADFLEQLVAADEVAWLNTEY